MDEDGRELGEVRGVYTNEELRWWWYVARRNGRTTLEWPPTLRPCEHSL